MKTKRPPRRKCYVCGHYGHPKDMVHGGYGRVMYSEAHFAHKACVADHDPIQDPQVGDCIQRMSKAHLPVTRTVVRRVNSDVFYRDDKGKEHKVWITTWAEWGMLAEVVKKANHDKTNQH